MKKTIILYLLTLCVFAMGCAAYHDQRKSFHKVHLIASWGALEITHTNNMLFLTGILPDQGRDSANEYQILSCTLHTIDGIATTVSDDVGRNYVVLRTNSVYGIWYRESPMLLIDGDYVDIDKGWKELSIIDSRFKRERR